jgi:hypothetical protein
MGRKLLYFLVVALVIVNLGGCKVKKILVKEDKTESRTMGFVKKVEEKELDYQSLEIKYATRAELDGKNYALNITYRNLKNEKLWISVRAMFGIEAARLYADRDSVWIVSRVGQFKEKGSWGDMSKLIGYPLDFMAFQGILARRIFYPGREDNIPLQNFMKKENGNGIMLVPDYRNDKQRGDSEVFGFMPQFVIDRISSRINGTRLAPEDSEWMFDVKYDPGGDDNLGLGKLMTIRGVDPESDVEMDLKIQNVAINEELKFPFQWF